MLFVLALLGGTAAAFAYTQGLKQTKSPIGGTTVTKVFSPVCNCVTSKAVIGFDLRRTDHLTLSIEDRRRDVVRVLVDDRRTVKGFHRFAWDGRLGDGGLAHSGDYRVRLDLADADRVLTLPNRIRLDSHPPSIRVEGRPVIRRGVLVVHYRVNEPAHAALYVGEKRVLLTYRHPLNGVLRLALADVSSPSGISAVRIAAVDLAGNMSKPLPLR